MAPSHHARPGGRAATRHRPWGLAGLLVLALLAGACGGSSGSDEKADQGTATTAAAKATTTDQVLRVALGTPVATVDPHRSAGAADFNYIYSAFEYLYQFDPSGASVPRLATGYTLSDDQKTYTFKLRPNVKFQDGSPFTAEDVKFSFERYRKPELKQVSAFRVTDATVTVIDPLTVSVSYPTVDGGFISNQAFVPIVPKAYIDKVGDDGFLQHPIGTGPFMFDSQVPGTSLTLRRWDGYWGAKPAYAGVKFLFQADPRARVNLLKAGQADVIGAVSPNDVGALGGFRVVDTPAGGSLMLSWDMLREGAPWQKPEVREAVAYAIDTKAIVKNVLKGYGSPSIGGLTRTTPGYDAANLKPHAYDPDKAKELLRQAGYPDGFPMDLVGVANGRYAGTTEMTQAVAGYLGDVGIKVNPRVVAYADWVNTQRRTTAVNGMFMSYGMNFDYQIFLTSIYTSVAAYSHQADTKLDAMVGELKATTDPDARAQEVGKIAKYVAEQNYMFPLVDDHAIFAMKKSVQWTPWTNQPSALMSTARPG